MAKKGKGHYTMW
jgi:hypothetical protein